MPRPRTRPTARAVLLLVVGGAAVAAAYALPSPPLLMLGIAALAVLPVALLLALREAPVLAVLRTVGGGTGAVAAVAPGMVAVGDELEVLLELAGPRRRTPPCRIADELAPLAPEWIGAASPSGSPSGAHSGGHGGEHDDGVIELPTLARSARIERRYRVVPGRRGAHSIGPLFVEVVEPFGLVRRIVPLGGTTPVVVAPRVEAALPAGFGGEAEFGERRSLLRLLHGGDEDLSTREYRAGDAIRRVHWRQSARLGELMVRQEEPGTPAVLRVVVDDRADGYADAAQFERVLELAASVSVAALAAGLTVELVLTGGGESLTATAGSESAWTLLAALASCEPVGGAGEFAPRAPADGAEVPTIVLAGAASETLLGAPPRSDVALALLVEPSPILPGVGAASPPARSVETLELGGWTLARLGQDAPLAPALADLLGRGRRASTR